MKKVVNIVLGLLILLSLIGCAKDPNPDYTITFELNGGTGDSTLEAVGGAEISEPTPTKEGYTFEGWFMDEEFEILFPFTTMPAKDLTLYAKWVGNPSTITLVLNGGTGDTSVVEPYGTILTEPTPTREGYMFVGWYLNAEFTHGYVFSTMPLEAITLYARWAINDYNITLVANNELATPDSVRGEIVQDKQTYSITTNDVEGYSFEYWRVFETSDIVSLEKNFIYTPTEDITLEAVYEELVAASEPTLYYETGFEDAAKGAYAGGAVTLSGESWYLEEALIGSLATDLKVSGNSVRIKNGYIETEFAVDDLAQVIFYAGTYGSDDHTTVNFQISENGSTWTTVDSFMSTGSMVEYNYLFDDAMFTNLSLSSESSYYLKIVSTTSERTNIDNFQIYTGEGQLIDDTPLYTITITDDMVDSYMIGETVDLTDCVATHPTSGDTTCDILGTVDNMVAGEYEITFYKLDEFGNVATETITIRILSESTSTDYLSMDLMSYYDDAEGLHGNALVDALHIIVNDGFSGVTYGDARYILDETDQDPNNSSNLILLYLGTSVNGAWDYGTTWNREHVWPQSLLGVSADNAKVNSASDLYNLMPTNPAENGARGNSPYSESNNGYEPRDEVKGDVARALFYMMVMYEELELVNTAPGLHEMGYLNVLIEWHTEDPVDAFELNRLEVIYSEQYNRNPFVDYPHFVELIWPNE